MGKKAKAPNDTEKKESTVHKYIGSFRGIGFLIKFYWKYGKWLMIWMMFFGCVFTPLSTAFWTLWSKILIDGYESGKSFLEIVLTISVGYFAVFLMWLIRRIFWGTYQEKRSTEVTAALNREIYKKAMMTDYRYFDNPEFFDDYTWAINQFSGKCREAYDTIVSLVTSFASIAALIAIMSALDPVLIIFSIVSLVLQTFFDLRDNKLNNDKREESIKTDRRCSYIHRIFYLKEWSESIKTTRAGNSFIDMYKSCVDEYKRIIDKYKYKTLAANGGSVFIDYMSDLASYIYIIWRVFAGALSIGSLLPLVTASGNLRYYFSDFFRFFKKTQEYGLYTARIKKFLNTASEIEVQDETKLLPLPSKPYLLEFDDVSFRYEDSDFGLKNLSFKVSPGQKLAIVGENGAGKTTLTKLILRLYDPQSGVIKINGKPISEYPVRELRQTMGVAFQDSPLYAMTLAENMQIYADTTREHLEEIAHTFGIDKMLEKAGSTLDSEVTREFSKDGLEMSGGEKQRIALSRLFVTDFGLIVLDEPSSALDPLAEYQLNKVMFESKSSTTTLMISHRLSTVVDADCILLVDNGRIIERGTHAELMHLGGKYYEMFTKQAENYVKAV